MDKTVTIFKHTHNLGSCYLGKVLEEAGFTVRSVGVPVIDLDEFDALEPDLLLIMGAPIGVYQAEDYPFVYKEIDIIQERIKADKPTLGICFGAQLIAKALGGDVYPGPNGKEIGWHRLFIHEAGKEHPARHLDGAKTSMFHWHGDTFDLPEGATLLASSDKYKQIFKYGEKTLGLQCHAEIRDVRLAEWYVANVDDLTGQNPMLPLEKLRRESDEYVGTLNDQVQKFLLEWLDDAGLQGA